MQGYLLRRHGYRRLLVGLGLSLALLTAPAIALPAQPTATPLTTHGQRSRAVAATVQGIISYTHWPTPRQHLTLCVMADPAYADDLLNGSLRLADTTITAKKFDIDNPAAGGDCDIVYLGALTDEQRFVLFEHLASHPVLSIGESNPDCASGSMFCLRIGPTRVRFQINLDSVARSGVRVDPQVLMLPSRDNGMPK